MGACGGKPAAGADDYDIDNEDIKTSR